VSYIDLLLAHIIALLIQSALGYSID